MQQGIHPQLHLLKVQCSCGNVIETTSTLESLHVEICSACHPFYTGKQKLIDTEGRVERFQKKYAKREGLLQKKKGPRTITIK